MLCKEIFSDSPEPVDHQLLLLAAHSDAEQRADLTQRRQQADGVLHRDAVDGVGLGQRAHLAADAVVLPVEQHEHGPHQLGILDDRLLSPAHHRLRDQLLQGAFRQKQRSARREHISDPAAFLAIANNALYGN